MNSFYFVYHTLLGPLSRALFRVAGLFSKKIARGLELRRKQVDGSPAWRRPWAKSSPVWIHCASGEFEYAKPVITRLAARGIPVIVSYFSPSYVAVVEGFQGVDLAVPLPWDRARDLTEFIEHYRPRALLIARTDAWPEMVRIARLRNIPSLLFSATLTASSGRARGPGRWMSRAVFSEIRDIWCVSADDVAAFASLGLTAKQQGDTRYDQVTARLAKPKPLRDELFSSSDLRPILISGSTWPEDERVLLEVVSRLHEKLRFIIVPHEPTAEHLLDLENQLRDRGVLSERYSTAGAWNQGVLLVDRMGLLAELYGRAHFAFVGGSFRKTVHSVMEPLAAGLPTFVGPKHQNNREALEMKAIAVTPRLHAVEVVGSSGEFIAKLEEILRERKPELAEKVKAEIAKRQGASDRVVEWILTAHPETS